MYDALSLMLNKMVYLMQLITCTGRYICNSFLGQCNVYIFFF